MDADVVVLTILMGVFACARGCVRNPVEIHPDIFSRQICKLLFGFCSGGAILVP